MTNEQIKKDLSGVVFDALLKNHTTYQIGGPAKYFFEAKTSDDLIKAVKVSSDNNLRLFVLGGGSNLIFLDKGFDGLVVKYTANKISHQGNEVFVDAGAVLNDLVLYSCNNGLAGMEKMSLIPGTVGGAIYGNAGAFEREMADSIEEAEIYDVLKDKRITLSKKQCEFEYRTSLFKKESGKIILSAKLALEKDSKEKLEECANNIKKKREDDLPGFPSAGCVFKNVPKDKALGNEKFARLADETEGGQIATWLLVDRVGLKGKSIGGAQVSEQHTNFVVNKGGATAGNVLKLIDLIKTKIRNEFGVQLDCEQRIISSKFDFKLPNK